MFPLTHPHWPADQHVVITLHFTRCPCDITGRDIHRAGVAPPHRIAVGSTVINFTPLIRGFMLASAYPATNLFTPGALPPS